MTKVWVAGDVGRQIINPSDAENQVQGSVLDGLRRRSGRRSPSRAGSVDQSNFDDFPADPDDRGAAGRGALLITDNPPTGLGEPALPPVIPALCNAIFAATGNRVRSLPLVGQGFSM